MVKIAPFAVEEWMDIYQPRAKYDLAETCCASISLDQLQGLCEEKGKQAIQLPHRLDYGTIRGSDKLRANLSQLYSAKSATPMSKENILITPGAIAANHLFLYAHIGAGDHVICHHPTYQQLYAIPSSLGAEVSLWSARSENRWVPDIEELKSLITPNTRLIIINNPNNPTGAVIGRSCLQEIVDIASANSIMILADEVYRPVFHGISPVDPEFPPSILSMGYDNVVATGSLSKAYSLAGIRVGWIASRSKLIIDRCADVRHYTTISVSQIDEQVAAYALDPLTVHNLLGRNIALARKNVEILERFMLKHDDMCSWVKPVAGTTAFIKFARDEKPVNSEHLCKLLMEYTGAMVLPGDVCFGEQFKGYIRLGYVNETEILEAGLKEFAKFLRKYFDDLPLSNENS